MQLTQAQLQTLKTWINTNLAGVFDQAAADALNAVASPDYWMWSKATAKAIIRAAVALESYTPVDAIPVGLAIDLTGPLLYSNRAFLAQLKQANALFLVQGDGTLDASDGNLRKSFQDCMRQIPTGTNGADKDGGWGAPANPGAVRLAMQNKATVGEKELSVAATGIGNDGGTRGTMTNPDNYGPALNGTFATGPVTLQNVIDAANS